ncbi:MAG: trypsin-like peptidase domain-containing protein [Anaerolineae bacterium]|nr:trypsin-like peptidase domain-containing protein [Anaerolineae bacterium]
MGWDFDDFEPVEDDEPANSRGRFLNFLIGAAVGVITLVLITSLVLTTVAHLLMDDTPVRRSVTRDQPSQADLVNANYRPSNWVEPNLFQIITPTPVAPDVVVQADAEHALLINIYERVNPSVVNIEVVSRFHSDTDVIDSSGSGFVLDMDGHIVTNSHVIREANEILVTFYDGYVIEAQIIGVDDYSDLAVIRVDPARSPLVPVMLGDSNTLQVGQRVIAIGNPFGLDGSMTVGIVSALGRSLPSAQLLDPNSYAGYSNPSIIQLDAAVNPGNSGGPLLDSYGQVIGINTAIRTENGVFQGIAFAVPVNTMKRVVPQLIQTGFAEYSWLGIQSPPNELGTSVAALADELGFPVRSGVMVSQVVADSPAYRAGLQGGTEEVQVRGVFVPTNGDIVVAINGMMVHDIDDLTAFLVENTSPGDTVVLTIVRNGQTLDVDVTLGVRPR